MQASGQADVDQIDLRISQHVVELFEAADAGQIHLPTWGTEIPHDAAPISGKLFGTARADCCNAYARHALVRQEMNHPHEANADDADLKHAAWLYVRIFCFRFVSSRAARSNSAYRRSVSSENS